MSRYDGLIIPRSYSEYINKTDAATLSQALQLGGVLDSAPTEDSVKAVKSGGVYDAIASAQSDLQDEIDTKQGILTFDDTPTDGSTNPVKSDGVYDALGSGANLIRAINNLDVGTSPAQDTDFIIAQTSGGGTNNYYRRTLKNMLSAALKTNGLEFGNKFIEFININVPALSFEQEGAGYTATFTDCYTFTHTFTSAPMVILLTQNDVDYTYCAILGTEVTATKITKIKVMRTNYGTGVSIKIKGIAIG